jgi:hypothetical protein
MAPDRWMSRSNDQSMKREAQTVLRDSKSNALDLGGAGKFRGLTENAAFMPAQAALLRPIALAL